MRKSRNFDIDFLGQRVCIYVSYLQHMTVSTSAQTAATAQPICPNNISGMANAPNRASRRSRLMSRRLRESTTSSFALEVDGGISPLLFDHHPYPASQLRQEHESSTVIILAQHAPSPCASSASSDTPFLQSSALQPKPRVLATSRRHVTQMRAKQLLRKSSTNSSSCFTSTCRR